MPHYRSRSRTSYQEQHEYVYDETSSSDSEDDHVFRGRSSFRPADLVETPSSPLRYKETTNRSFAHFSETDDLFRATAYFDSRAWPSHHPNLFNTHHPSYGTAQFEHKKCTGCQCASKQQKQDKSSKEKTKDKKPKHDSKDHIQKEKDELKKRLQELEDRENHHQKEKHIIARREILDVDLDIAECNSRLSSLLAFRHESRGRRSISRSAVRFESFDDIFKIRDRH